LGTTRLPDLKQNNVSLKYKIRKAVAFYWQTRSSQSKNQKDQGKIDQGSRSAVTGGAQMDGFIDLFVEQISLCGISTSCIRRKKSVELPGFFRPTKEWDLLVIRDRTLIAVIEAKSQVGPSFGNNFNNRTEEAIGSAVDLWTAFREHAYLESPQPFLGYFFMIEDCAASNAPVSVQEPHFIVFPEFKGASYIKRYELFCRKLVLERHYSAASFITSNSIEGPKGNFKTPAEDLSIERFIKVLSAQVSSFI
jgi:hypothetical protein